MSLSENKNQGSDSVGDVDDVVATLARVREQTEGLAKAIERMEQRLARGTGDHAEAAQRARVAAGVTAPMVEPVVPVEPAPPPPPKLDLRARVEAALIRDTLDAQQLAKAVGASSGKVNELIKQLKAEQAIYNVGIAENPKWTWRVGDAADSKVLRHIVVRLISERPMTTRELANATGARMSRVGGQLVEIQRSGAEIINLGHGHVYRYFMISASARPAKLQPKKLGKTARRGQDNG